jgi:hypothetical protein
LDKLFEPTALRFSTEYPELEKVEEFKPLSESDYRFVWSMGNITSPFFEKKPEIAKINACIKYAYYGKDALGKSQILRYEKGLFEDNIKVAIDKMREFSPTKRQKGKDMLNKIFNSFEKIVNMSDDMVENPDLHQKYIDNAVKITEALPDLIRKAEEGFGFKQRIMRKNEKEATELDDAMSSEETNDD